MKLFHIPKVKHKTGTLLRYTLSDDLKHHAEYSVELDGVEQIRTDKESVEDVYGKELTDELLNETLPKKVIVYYDDKNHDDTKPDLINDVD